MAIETKIEEVDNEYEEFAINIMARFGWRLRSSQRILDSRTRPTNGVIYQNMVYIHSRTDTVDFTKLIFERDTHMPYYDEIAALEDEFFSLATAKTEKRPLPPPPRMNFKQWVRAYRPHVVSTKTKVLMGCLIFFPSLLIVSILQRISIFSSIPFALLFIPLAVISLIIPPLYAGIRSSLARHQKASKDHVIIQNLYEKYCDDHQCQLDAVSLYDHAEQRIPEILAEVDELVSSV